jgi:hypothetical protein
MKREGDCCFPRARNRKIRSIGQRQQALNVSDLERLELPNEALRDKRRFDLFGAESGNEGASGLAGYANFLGKPGDLGTRCFVGDKSKIQCRLERPVDSSIATLETSAARRAWRFSQIDELEESSCLWNRPTRRDAL